MLTWQILPIVATLIPNLHSTSTQIQLPVLKFLYLSILQLNMMGKQVFFQQILVSSIIVCHIWPEILVWNYIWQNINYLQHTFAKYNYHQYFWPYSILCRLKVTMLVCMYITCRNLHWLLHYGELVKNYRNHVQGAVLRWSHQKWNHFVKVQTFTYDCFPLLSFYRPFHKVYMQLSHFLVIVINTWDLEIPLWDLKYYS